tara:strand:+ start:954 stop:1184 length:231 start_codon:yes stop_codon:yes gene_type:complete
MTLVVEALLMEELGGMRFTSSAVVMPPAASVVVAYLIMGRGIMEVVVVGGIQGVIPIRPHPPQTMEVVVIIPEVPT